jgi:YVTN family beta-propeller protein
MPTLQAGTRLGPYEICELLGAGGMGEVYRARDVRLGREVAVKVVLGADLGNPDRLRQFALEARAAAAVSHPNILAVHDVGDYDGHPFLVSELLHGQSLRARLGAGRLPVSKALECARQIALGLAAAHGQGIVHRDLKPDNVFLTDDGRVKILDFGLAKLGRSERWADVTVTLPGAGAAVGTPRYTAPEQARAQATDARADIFSFGAVLYEMLAGCPAFEAGSVADTLTLVLTSDPPPLTSVVPEVPRALEALVRRCLEKAREDRFQSVHDLALALEAVGTEVAPTRSPRTFVRAAGGTIGRAGGLVAAAALLAALAVFGIGDAARSRGRAAFLGASAVGGKQESAGGPTFRNLRDFWAGPTATDSGAVYVANTLSDSVSVISPVDGTVTASIRVGSNPYGIAVDPTRNEVYVANSGSGEVTVIDATRNAAAISIAVGANPYAIVLSPDGARAYVSNGGSRSISVIDTTRHTVTRTIPGLGNVRGLAMSPDGTRIYAVNEDEVATVAVIDTVSDALRSTLDLGGSYPVGVALSPDGRRAYVTVGQNGSPFVAVVDTVGNAVTDVISVGSTPTLPAITPDGTRLYVPNYGSASVSVIDTATDRVVATLAVGNGPYAVAVSPDGGTAYVSNAISGSVSAINVMSNTVTATTAVGTMPAAVATVSAARSHGVR